MQATSSQQKAVVHISGTLLRRTWYSKELNSCIVVRPAGEDRDKVAYVVNQARFDGPSELVFSANPREVDEKGTLAGGHGFVSALPGFDNAVMIYLEVDEDAIHVQPSEGSEYIPFSDFRRLVEDREITVQVLNPMLEDNC
jgi:hypothetical protein